jgi:hypothetical protein
MPATSEVILNSQTHSGLNSDPITVTGDKFKGDGYYGWGDGLHTISFETTVFVGTITIQASLATLPEENDWFNVDGATCSVGTGISIVNFTGNFVWVRAVATYTAGTINRVLFNH